MRPAAGHGIRTVGPDPTSTSELPTGTYLQDSIHFYYFDNHKCKHIIGGNGLVYDVFFYLFFLLSSLRLYKRS